MEAKFFADTRPGRFVRWAGTDIEVPLLYRRVDTFGAMFTADLAKVRALLPSDLLHPVQSMRGRALVTIGGYDFIDSSFGPFAALPIAIPVVLGRRPPPLLPALAFESSWPGFGHLVFHLANSSAVVSACSRGEWGYPAFEANLKFENTPEAVRCQVTERNAPVLTLEVEKRGLILPAPARFPTYAVRDDLLLRTTWRQHGFGRVALGARGCTLTLGDTHPVARSLLALDLDPKAVASRYSLDLSAIQPEAEIVATSMRLGALREYAGEDERGIAHQPRATSAA